MKVTGLKRGRQLDGLDAHERRGMDRPPKGTSKAPPPPAARAAAIFERIPDFSFRVSISRMTT